MDFPAMASAGRRIAKSRFAPSELAFERFLTRMDIAVSLQCRILSKSFTTSRYLTRIWFDSSMQTDMSITIGLARKDLLTYWAYIFRIRLEEVQSERPAARGSEAYSVHDSK